MFSSRTVLLISDTRAIFYRRSCEFRQVPEKAVVVVVASEAESEDLVPYNGSSRCSAFQLGTGASYSPRSLFFFFVGGATQLVTTVYNSL